MATDPISGPMPRERLKELADLPAGQAREAIQEYDPLWGRAPGEKIEWEVSVERSGRDTGHAFVRAATEKEAELLADQLQEDDVEWDYDSDSFIITSIKPRKKRG